MKGVSVMYQALYRKWRPKTFDQVVGQPHITETLKNQISTGRLSHAYLFIGTRGTGKTTCAKIMAKALNCEHPENGNPCGKCPACLGIEDGSIMDVVEIDAASNNGVDNVRQLRDEAIFSPVSVRKRVYIIDEVHMLSTAAFNALLKILEEPPEHLTFILATTELNKVPATILSRCQRHSFKRLDSATISAHLMHVAECEHFDLEKTAADLIAGLAEGGMRDALSLLDQCSAYPHIDLEAVYSAMGLMGNCRTAKLLDYTVKKDTESAISLFTELWNDGKDPATLLGELNTLLRDCLMMSIAPKNGAALISGGYDLSVLSVFIKKLTKAELISRMNTIGEYLSRMKDSKSPKLSAELCIVSLCDPTITEGLDGLRARISRLEEDMKNAPPSFHDIPYDDEPPVRRSEVCEPEELDIDPAEFAEYQPEDDLLDKAASPVDMNPDAPAEAKNAPADSESLWRAILDKAEENLFPGKAVLLNDPSSVRAEISYDTLQLYVKPDFTFIQINDQNVIIRLRQAANEVTGRSLKVLVTEMKSEKASPSRDINELKKFNVVKFN